MSGPQEHPEAGVSQFAWARQLLLEGGLLVVGPADLVDSVSTFNLGTGPQVVGTDVGGVGGRADGSSPEDDGAQDCTPLLWMSAPSDTVASNEVTWTETPTEVAPVSAAREPPARPTGRARSAAIRDGVPWQANEQVGQPQSEDESCTPLVWAATPEPLSAHPYSLIGADGVLWHSKADEPICRSDTRSTRPRGRGGIVQFTDACCTVYHFDTVLQMHRETPLWDNGNGRACTATVHGQGISLNTAKTGEHGLGFELPFSQMIMWSTPEDGEWGQTSDDEMRTVVICMAGRYTPDCNGLDFNAGEDSVDLRIRLSSRAQSNGFVASVDSAINTVDVWTVSDSLYNSANALGRSGTRSTSGK